MPLLGGGGGEGEGDGRGVGEWVGGREGEEQQQLLRCRGRGIPRPSCLLRHSCRLLRTKDVMVNGHRVQVRYNDTCHFYQPPRAHHCSVNDNCIERFDHHCPWVGTTIGLVRTRGRWRHMPPPPPSPPPPPPIAPRTE